MVERDGIAAVETKCKYQGHVWQLEGEELGQYPDGTPTMFEVYECIRCEKVKYEPVAD